MALSSDTREDVELGDRGTCRTSDGSARCGIKHHARWLFGLLSTGSHRSNVVAGEAPLQSKPPRLYLVTRTNTNRIQSRTTVLAIQDSQLWSDHTNHFISAGVSPGLGSATSIEARQGDGCRRRAGFHRQRRGNWNVPGK